MAGMGLGPEAVSRAAPQGLALRQLGRARRPDLRYAVGVGVLVGLYYGAAHLGYALNFTGPVAAIVWLPAGVGIAYLYLAGLRYWPGVLVGDLLVNNYDRLPLGSAIGQSCGNLLEVLVAAVLLHRLARFGSPLDSVGGVARMLVALAAGTAVSATIGLLSLRLGDVVTTGSLPKLWRTWWLGDTCGALLVVPLALAWSRPAPRAWLKQRWLEGALLIVAVAGLSELALRTSRPLAYLVFPALIWAALRFGQRGATLAVALAGGYAVWATTHYTGPFYFHSITHAVLATQLYISVATLSTLCLAAVVSEREVLAARLLASRARLVGAADIERRRIERNLHDGAQQRLTALAVTLKLAEEESRTEPGRAPAMFAQAENDLLVAIDELRDLAHGMHPAALREHGLAHAIRSIAAGPGVPVEFVDLPSGRFAAADEATAYFVAVEAIANAQRHSGASAVLVRVTWAAGMLTVEVLDDGRGGAAERAGLGLEGLRDRVEAVGGDFSVDSPEGAGTRIVATVPATVAGS